MPNPWMLVGGMLAILFAFGAGYVKGGKDCEADYTAAALSEQSKAIVESEQQAREDQAADSDSLRHEAAVESKHETIEQDIDSATLVVADCPDTLGPEFWRLFRASGGADRHRTTPPDSSDGPLPTSGDGP